MQNQARVHDDHPYVWNPGILDLPATQNNEKEKEKSENSLMKQAVT